MEEIRKVYQKYDLIYRHNPQSGHTWLHSYILHEGYHLFIVTATYAKQHPPCGYYVIARSKKEARELFKATYTCLDILTSVEMCDEETEHSVCAEFWRKINSII